MQDYDNNPFTILDIAYTADKKQILQAVTKAMQKKQYDVKTIAQAQKQLFNVSTRAIQEFRNDFDMLSLLDKNITNIDNKSPFNIELLHCFDD